MANGKIDRASLGQYGVYLVAAELCRMGYTAVTTSRNAKAVDILAFNPANGVSVGVQVKTVKKWPKIGIIVINWVPKEMGNIPFLAPFVFVFIQERTKYPRYFVVPKDHMPELLKKSWQWYKDNYKHRKPMDEIEKTKQPLCLLLDKVKSYKDKWENLGLGPV